MKIINQSWEYTFKPEKDQILNLIENAGRVCYKTELNSTPDFIKKRISSGHESILEHMIIGIKIITDRGVTHEIVRHRIGCSYSQESTRYVNYNKVGIEFIQPVDFKLDSSDIKLLEDIESHYNQNIKNKRTPQQARYFLPNGLKTEIFMTLNIRAWRHFLKLRCSSGAHPQMRNLALGLLKVFHGDFPILFDDIYNIYLEQTEQTKFLV
jgi:thymidylate synthase (FAD)